MFGALKQRVIGEQREHHRLLFFRRGHAVSWVDEDELGVCGDFRWKDPQRRARAFVQTRLSASRSRSLGATRLRRRRRKYQMLDGENRREP